MIPILTLKGLLAGPTLYREIQNDDDTSLQSLQGSESFISLPIILHSTLKTSWDL